MATDTLNQWTANVDAIDTRLTDSQRGRLDGIGARDGNTVRVIYWSVLHRGPVLRYPGGNTLAIGPGGHKVPMGQLIG